MDSQIPVLPSPDASEERGPTQMGHIWGRASTMAAERSQTERERQLKTYLYASAYYAVIFLVVLGASLLFVMHTVAIVCSSIAHFVLHPFRAVRPQ